MNEPADYRQLNFQNEDQVIAEVVRLRHGYRQLGNWSLPQACWHLYMLIDKYLAPPENPTPTPEQTAKKIGFVDQMLKTRKSPPGFQAPPQLTPSPELTEDAVDHFIQSLFTMKEYPHALAGMGPVGPVTIEEFRQVHFVHAEHHLGFLVPTTKRRALRFNTAKEVVHDVKQLQVVGYTQCGNWNLPQTCRHLTIAITRTMKPHTEPATPEQLATIPIKDRLLKFATLPKGVQAPEIAVPPADCTEADIEAMIKALEAFEKFQGPTASHRLFGPLTLDEYQKLTLLHCAHHLSHLTPKGER
jgi:Protein of unknown function (DUF1569)